MSEISIMRPKAMQWAIEAFDWLNDILKGFGIFAGALLASVADWVLGTITLTVLFQNAPAAGFDAWVLGLVWSGASWGVQLILWQMILSGNFSRLFQGKSQSTIQKAQILLVILAKLADDVIDLMSIYWLVLNNPFQLVLPRNVYMVLAVAVAITSWVLVGFSEMFLSVSLAVLREKKRNDRSRGSSQHQPPAHPSQNPYRYKQPDELFRALKK